MIVIDETTASGRRADHIVKLIEVKPFYAPGGIREILLATPH